MGTLKQRPKTESDDGKRAYTEGVETSYYVTYRYRGVPYVPHYDKPDCYIPPGYTRDAGILDRNGARWFYADRELERSALELERAGATKVPMFLWRRNKKARYAEIS